MAPRRGIEPRSPRHNNKVIVCTAEKQSEPTEATTKLDMKLTAKVDAGCGEDPDEEDGEADTETPALVRLHPGPHQPHLALAAVAHPAEQRLLRLVRHHVVLEHTQSHWLNQIQFLNLTIKVR